VLDAAAAHTKLRGVNARAIICRMLFALLNGLAWHLYGERFRGRLATFHGLGSTTCSSEERGEWYG